MKYRYSDKSQATVKPRWGCPLKALGMSHLAQGFIATSEGCGKLKLNSINVNYENLTGTPM